MTAADDRLPNGFHTIEFAVAELAAGRTILVVDDEDRENEGDLIFAGELATAENTAFMVRYSSGVICVPMPPADCDRLELSPMTLVNTDPKGTAYTVSVDAKVGVSTGISAADRARTIRALSRPGHRAGRPEPTRPRVPAAVPGGRGADPPRTHRGRGRPDADGRPAPGRRDRRSRQR